MVGHWTASSVGVLWEADVLWSEGRFPPSVLPGEMPPVPTPGVISRSWLPAGATMAQRLGCFSGTASKGSTERVAQFPERAAPVPDTPSHWL